MAIGVRVELLAQGPEKGVVLRLVLQPVGGFIVRRVVDRISCCRVHSSWLSCRSAAVTVTKQVQKARQRS